MRRKEQKERERTCSKSYWEGVLSLGNEETEGDARVFREGREKGRKREAECGRLRVPNRMTPGRGQREISC